MNNFLQQGLTKYLEKTELSKIKNTKILIAGAGGVGSNAAMLLVRCGFEKITIIDYDELEPSNLNRQFFFNEQVGTLKVCGLKENLLKINHQATITIIKERLTVDNVNNLIKNQDIILEAFDDIIAKKIIVEACHLLAKHIIAVSGIAGHRRCGDRAGPPGGGRRGWTSWSPASRSPPTSTRRPNACLWGYASVCRWPWPSSMNRNC